MSGSTACSGKTEKIRMSMGYCVLRRSPIVSLHGGRCHGLSGGVCVGVSGYIFCLEPVDAISVLSGSADALFGVHFPAAESLKQ